jgi:hypothetical protein
VKYVPSQVVLSSSVGQHAQTNEVPCSTRTSPSAEIKTAAHRVSLVYKLGPLWPTTRLFVVGRELIRRPAEKKTVGLQDTKPPYVIQMQNFNNLNTTYVQTTVVGI